MSNDAVVIVSAARTPIGGFQGVFAGLSAVELGTQAVSEVLARAQSDASAQQLPEIDELLFGCVLPAGLGQAPARQVALHSGIASAVPCTTVNKVCGSGMKAAFIGHDAILAGTTNAVVVGGMESMSNAPHLLARAKTSRPGHGELKDHMFLDGLEDAYSGRLMGSYAQALADQHELGREQMDDYAIESLRRAQDAISSGVFKDEICPVTIQQKTGSISVSEDEQPSRARIEKIRQLKPAFSKDGTVTAANSSSISDGAAALLLMRESHAIAQGYKPLARIKGNATHARAPGEFAIAPADAIATLLDNINWSVSDVDLFEINEAFAMVALHSIQTLQLDHGKVNVHGGACALGHPLGASGARIIVTLIYALRRLGKKRGVASLCIGGGEATAMAIELC